MTYQTGFYLAFYLVIVAATVAITPVMRRFARARGIVDEPDSGLKTQKAPVPYLGGAAVLLGVMAGLLVYRFYPAGYLSAPDQLRLLALMSGTLLMGGLGLLDDLHNLPPYMKLLVEAAAAVLLISCGLHVQIVYFPAWLNYALTVFWIVGMTNAFNLIDIMDGLASGVAGIASLFFFLLAITTPGLDKTFVAVGALAVAGGTTGFLVFNFYPAKIYLGDMGSLSIGFFLGGLAIGESYTSHTTLGLIIPLFVLAIPLYDTFYVIVLRLLAGRSIFRGSKDHFALRIRALGFSVPQTVALCYAVSLIFGVTALLLSLSSGGQAQLLAVVMVGAAIAVGVFLKRRVRMQ